ncbi:SMC-Scp complex subunit ScpB [Thermoflavifilum thermophilum]|uniref:Segregation and condensation protein B n=1 Tax=Thermoflavifilum thermophilum TaxID=1393122 RepID=A0A1I7N7F7_9BACT|nr:SMC-Scp complex subunit ScpB [Thermoflavifilum thermophilum]SFV30571.1 segregation and condensation protein B [Thermoflavifilum thermophilum]
MELMELIPHVEALIFAADHPLTVSEITTLVNKAFGFLDHMIPEDQVEAAIQAVVEKYADENFPFEVKYRGGGYQFLTKKNYFKTVAQLNGDKFLKRLSPAALETLAIIAYRQPVSKAEIEYIRGVNADYAIQKLLEKELIVISGRSEDQPGKPLLYSTSRLFMDYFGLNGPEDLPPLQEFSDDTLMKDFRLQDDTPSQTQDTTYIVSEDGTLQPVPQQDDEQASENSAAEDV